MDLADKIGRALPRPNAEGAVPLSFDVGAVPGSEDDRALRRAYDDGTPVQAGTGKTQTRVIGYCEQYDERGVYAVTYTLDTP